MIDAMPSIDALLDAIRQQDLDAVRAALDGGVEANARDARGNNALSEAARCKSAAIARLLLERGASVDECTFTRTALSWACQIGGYRDERAKSERATIELVQALLDAGAAVDGAQGDRTYSPLRVAIQHATPAVVELLLGARPAVDESHVALAIERGEHALVLPLMKKAGGVDRSALLVALCARGDRTEQSASIARTLLALGATQQRDARDGSTPAHYAAYWGDFAMLHALIERGADLDAALTNTWPIEDSAKKRGTTPRAMLDESLRFTLESGWEAAGDDRARWERLAIAMGTTLDAWSERVSRPEPPKPSRKKAR